MNSRIIIYSLVALLAAAGAYYFLRPTPRKTAGPPPPLEKVLPKEFAEALKPGQGGTQTAATSKSSTPITSAAPVATETQGGTYTGNGFDKLHVSATNSTTRLAPFTLKAGDIYESGKNRVVLLEGCDKQIPAGGTIQLDLATAPLSSSNIAGKDTYTKSTASISQLASVIERSKSRPDLSRNAIRTAVLILAENPTVDIFAQFPRLHSISASDDFKVSTLDIINALQLLADAGVTGRVAASDAQLKVEAMIDPQSHEAAMHYYNITPETQWAYWKHELLEGDPATRHYALYGIARYYPDVALVMLPKWAKETRLSPIYRLSAVRALAMTNRPDAIKILQQLEQQFDPETDLHKSADRAAKYLSQQFNQPS